MSAPRVPELLRAPWRARLALPAPEAGAELAAAPCPGCGRPVPEQYCGACGEPRAGRDLSLGALLAAGVEHLTSLDVRLVRTLRLLVTKPGQLTVEYRRGVRAAYTRPFQLFLLVIGAAFLAVSVMGSKPLTQKTFLEAPGMKALGPRVERMMHESKETPEQFYARFDRRSDDVKRAMLVAFVPALAACLMLFYLGSGRYVVEHLVFATHYLSFLVLSFIGWKVVGRSSRRLMNFYFATHGGATPPWADNTLMVFTIVGGLAVAGYYVWAALRRAYDDSGGDAAARTGMLTIIVFFGVIAYALLDYRLTLSLM